MNLRPRPAADLLPAAAARRVLLLRAFEQGAGDDNPLWTADDRAWATRVAREAGAAALPPAAALALRAEHALQRLAPRDAGVRRLLAPAGGRLGLAALLLMLAFGAGLLVDAIGSSQRINLLAPPVWGVVLWNLLVYALLPWPAAAGPRGLRRALAAAGRALRGRAGHRGPLQAYALDWARCAQPLATARAASLLHAAAAALALGLVAGLYLRGLVLDYRVGWQSTFLDADAVRAVLALLLAPASALTGIHVPDAAALQALRVPGTGPDGAAAAAGTAAPWIHLIAATLMLAVIVPRTLLAAAAAWRARRAARRIALPLDEPDLQRLLLALRGADAVVQLLAHGAAPSPQATLGLQAWCAAALGAATTLRAAPVIAYGDEEAAERIAPDPGTTLRVALVDLAATPEDDSHGRFLDGLRTAAPGIPLLLVADEASFARRFAGLPARRAERHAAWQRLASAHGAGWLALDLERPAVDNAEQALQAALAH